MTGKMPAEPPRLDDEYLNYIKHKVSAGWLRQADAIMALNARGVTRAKAKYLLTTPGATVK
jgi:hypothetical protein